MFSFKLNFINHQYLDQEWERLLILCCHIHNFIYPYEHYINFNINKVCTVINTQAIFWLKGKGRFREKGNNKWKMESLVFRITSKINVLNLSIWSVFRCKRKISLWCLKLLRFVCFRVSAELNFNLSDGIALNCWILHY